MQAQEPAGVEADESRPLRLDGGPHRLEPDKEPLPSVGDPGGIGRYEGQPRAAGKRLTEGHPRMDAERLRSERDLADALGSPRLGCESDGLGEKIVPVRAGDGQREAGKYDTDDDGRHANTCSHVGRTTRAVEPRA
jgi:hypothetical protein